MSNDKQDNPGIKVPPPLIYLLPLLLGLMLDKKKHVPFLPSGAARFVGWPLIGGGVLLGGRGAGAHRQARAEADDRRSVSIHPQPCLSWPGDDLRRDSHLKERFVSHPLPPAGSMGDRARGDRARGAVSGTHLRTRVSGLQGEGTTLGIVELAHFGVRLTSTQFDK